MKNALDFHYTFKSIAAFTAPTVLFQLFVVFYQGVDGYFIANYVDANGLAALNLCFPVVSIFLAASAGLTSGGNAVIGAMLGANRNREAAKTFAALLAFGLLVGGATAALFLWRLDAILTMLGAETPELAPPCREYLSILLLGAPFLILQGLTAGGCILVGKPFAGTVAIIAGGLANIALDYVFVAHYHWGIAGAARATIAGYSLSALVGLSVFYRDQASIKVDKPVFRFDVFQTICLNGTSEFVNVFSLALTSLLLNWIVLREAGSLGAAALTVVMSVGALSESFFVGFSEGIAPAISFNDGKKDAAKLRALLDICVKIVAIVSVAATIGLFFVRGLIPRLFDGGIPELRQAIFVGLSISLFQTLFVGVNIFTSTMCAATLNAKESTLISLCRSAIFLLFFLLVLPTYFGINGVWLAIPGTEIASCFVAAYFLRKKFVEWRDAK